MLFVFDGVLQMAVFVPLGKHMSDTLEALKALEALEALEVVGLHLRIHPDFLGFEDFPDKVLIRSQSC